MQCHQFLRDMNLPGVSPNDRRKLEVVVNGLPLYHGAQVGIDATIVSPVRGDGQPRPTADSRDGVALQTALRAKRRRYRDLQSSQRCRLLVAAVEVGGRWSTEAYYFLVHLAKAKAREAPAVLKMALTAAWVRRWTGMLAHASMSAFADSLVQERPSTASGVQGPEPPAGDLLTAGP